MDSNKGMSDDEAPRVKHFNRNVNLTRKKTIMMSPTKKKEHSHSFPKINDLAIIEKFSEDEKSNHSLTMENVEVKVKEIMTVQTKAIVEDIDKHHKEAVQNTDEQIKETKSSIETIKNMLQNMMELMNSDTKIELQTLRNLIQDN